MEQIEFNGEVLEYNEKYWELREIPKEFLEKHFYKGFDKALHYIGPIVDGAVVEEYPWRLYDEIPMYRTFEGCKGLTKSPAIYRNYSYEMFKDCDDFTDIEGAYRKYHRYGGCSYSNLLDGSGIKCVYDVKKINDSIYGGNDAIACMNAKPETKKVLRMLLGHPEYTEQDWQSITPVDDKVYFSTGAFLCLKVIHRASEITEQHKIIHNNCIVTCEVRPIRVTYENVTVYFSADDFINDTDDVDIMCITGYNLTQPEYNECIKIPADATITVGVDCVIHGDSLGIACRDTLTIKGTGQTLIVENNDPRQPCIGVVTHDGMSYGRWEPARDKFTKLTLDGVYVVCESVIPNFSIGRYGTNDYPEIELLNGATLECPETLGHRVMIRSGAEGLYGSTKRCNDAVYEIECMQISPNNSTEKNFQGVDDIAKIKAF